MADDDDIGLWDKLKGLGGGIADWMGQPSPASPERATNVTSNLKGLTDVLKSAGYDEKSPEYQLVAEHAKYLSNIPQPKSRTLGQDLLATGLNAGAAALFRGAGAGVMEAQQPVQSMVSDWRSQRDIGLTTAQKAHEAGSTQVIPQIQNWVIQAAENRRRDAIANQREAIYGVSGAKPASGGGVADPAAAAAAGAARVPLPADPATREGGAPTGGLPAGVPSSAPDGGAAGATPSKPDGIQRNGALWYDPSAERPHGFGNLAFHTDVARDWFARSFSDLRNGNLRALPAVKGADGKEVPPQDLKPSDLEKAAIEMDNKLYQESPAFLATKEATLQGTKNIGEKNRKLEETYAAASQAARLNDNDLLIQEKALIQSRAKGKLGVGPLSPYTAWVNGVAKQLGLPAMNQAALNTITELSNSSAVERMKETTGSGAGSGAGVRTLAAFMKGVPNAVMSEEGFVAAGEAIRAINAFHHARAAAAAELFSTPESYYTTKNAQKLIDEKAMPAFNAAVKAAERAMATGKYPSEDPGSPGHAKAVAGEGGKFSDAQKATLKEAWEAGDADKRKEIEDALRARKVDPASVFGAPKKPLTDKANVGAPKPGGTNDTSAARTGSAIKAKPITAVEPTSAGRTGAKVAPWQKINAGSSRPNGMMDEQRKKREQELEQLRGLLP